MGISMSTVARRVENARGRMREADLDALVIYSAPPALWAGTATSGMVRYLTNWSPPMSLLPSLLVLPTEGEPVLFTHAAQFPGHQRELSVKDVRPDPDSASKAAELLLAGGHERVGLVGRAEMPTATHEALTSRLDGVQLVDGDHILERMRSVKDAEEIELLRAGAKIADAMLYAGMITARQPHVSAHSVMLEMEHVGRRLGASFAHCWLDTGPAPRYIYHETQYLDRPIVEGDQLHTGTYVVFEGYWAHELRMGVRGKVTPELRRHFEMVLEVQQAGLEALTPGRPIRDVAHAMETLIEEFSPFTRASDPFRFRQGHGLGLEYSDPLVTGALQTDASMYHSAQPSDLQQDQILVEPGMVIELHPNFNTAELGMTTIGDMVLVTDSGPEILTGFPRELYEI